MQININSNYKRAIIGKKKIIKNNDCEVYSQYVQLLSCKSWRSIIARRARVALTYECAARRAGVAHSYVSATRERREFICVIDCQASHSSGVRRLGLKPNGSEYVRKKSGKSNWAPKAKIVFPDHFADTKPDSFWLCKTEKSGEDSCKKSKKRSATCSPTSARTA